MENYTTQNQIRIGECMYVSAYLKKLIYTHIPHLTLNIICTPFEIKYNIYLIRLRI